MWPSHLADDVRFDRAAATEAASELRRLAAAIDAHATVRAQQLAAAAHFRGHTRDTVDELTGTQGHRATALVHRLHAEARAIEDDAVAATRAADRLADARARWRAEQARRAAQDRAAW